jgi:hypothetical protein
MVTPTSSTFGEATSNERPRVVDVRGDVGVEQT